MLREYNFSVIAPTLYLLEWIIIILEVDSFVATIAALNLKFSQIFVHCNRHGLWNLRSTQENTNLIIWDCEWDLIAGIQRNKPSKMSATLVHSHFWALKFVQFFSYSSFVFGCEPCPWFIGPTIIVVCLCHFDIIVETYDFLFLEFVDGRTKTEFSQQISLLFLFLFLLFGGWLSCLCVWTI